MLKIFFVDIFFKPKDNVRSITTYALFAISKVTWSLLIYCVFNRNKETNTTNFNIKTSFRNNSSNSLPCSSIAQNFKYQQFVQIIT